MAKRIKVEFDLELPADANAEQIRQWLVAELVNDIHDDENPLSEYKVVADHMTLKFETAS